MPRARPSRKCLAVHARQLALKPRLQILRRSRRPLLCGMEQARRPALAHHVHRIAPMGTPVLINGTWYYARAQIARLFCPYRARSRDSLPVACALRTSSAALLQREAGLTSSSKGALRLSWRYGCLTRRLVQEWKSVCRAFRLRRWWIFIRAEAPAPNLRSLSPLGGGPQMRIAAAPPGAILLQLFRNCAV